MNFNELLNCLKLNESEFIFKFQTHPNFPSAFAFRDTLIFLGLKNDAYSLKKDYWNELQ